MRKCPQCQATYPDSASFCPRDAAALTSADAFAPGMTIRRKYRIISEIGRGGMGVVYRAQHLLFQEDRALKVVSAAFATDPRFASRFLTEVLITRQLQHPNIVRVEDADETEDGQPFAVMEYVAGESLRQVIHHSGALDPARALYIAAQVCAALAAAHQRGIIHRDIKPDNILLVPRPGGTDLVKVLDFGIAKAKEEAALSLPEVTSTKTGFFVGTPEYSSPEQALGKKGAELDERTDLYSLGVVLYEMLSGQLPFRADTPMGMLLHQIQTPAERPCLELPDSVVAVLMKSLAKDTAQRFSSAEEMRMALDRALHELRQSFGVPTPAEMPSAETRRQFVPTPPVGQTPAGQEASGQSPSGAGKAAAASAGSQPARASAPLRESAPAVPPADRAVTPGEIALQSQAPFAFQPSGAAPLAKRTKGSGKYVFAAIAVVCILGIAGALYLFRSRPQPSVQGPPGAASQVSAAPNPAPEQPATGTQRGGPDSVPAKDVVSQPPGAGHDRPARAAPDERAHPDAVAMKKAGAAPSSPPAASPAETAYNVQVAALADGKAADELLKSLKARGYQARVVQEGNALFRILVGPFTNRAQADDMRARLELQGFKAVVRE